MPKIKPQPLHESDYDDIESQLKGFFFEQIFYPLLVLLKPHNAQVKKAAKEFKNAGNAGVVAALKAGKIQYTSGVFSGDFSSATSKELRKMGASWNKQTKTFALPANQLPPDVAAMAAEYANAAKAMHDELDKRLKEIGDQLAGIVEDAQFDAMVTVGNVQKGFKKSAGDVLGANADLDEAGIEKLSKQYTENLKPYVKKFSDEMVAELREMVAANAEKGYRFDRLISRIQGRFDVSQTKAEFLAQQETAMLVSRHRRIRFEDVGVTRYVWRTSGKTSVRDDHKKLNGREFLYSDPPIVDSATGRRGNPGEDFGCQCVDDPVLPRVEAMA